MQVVPKDFWVSFAHAITLHGRYVCKRRKPECDGCALAEHCELVGL